MSNDTALDFTADTVVTGTGQGAALFLRQPLSFWGGYDSIEGSVIDPRHPQRGVSLAGRVMLMERAKGSSSSSSVLAEAIRNGTGPSAIIMRERDLIVALGCIVASELYGIDVPVATADDAAWKILTELPDTARVSVQASDTGCRVSVQA